MHDNINGVSLNLRPQQTLEETVKSQNRSYHVWGFDTGFHSMNQAKKSLNVSAARREYYEENFSMFSVIWHKFIISFVYQII